MAHTAGAAAASVAQASPTMVLKVAPAFRVTDEEFFAFCQQNPDWNIEKNAQGEWIFMPPTGGTTGDKSSEINYQLRGWMYRTGTGRAFDSSTGFVLPNGATRSPDAAWVRQGRLGALTPEQRQAFLPLCPDFVVELRSRTDSLTELQAKMTEYRDNGAELGWLIDPHSDPQTVYVYRPGRDVEEVERPDQLSADPELPGFTLDLRPIWDPLF